MPHRPLQPLPYRTPWEFYAIQDINPEIVKGQIEAVMDDIHPDAIKVGMVNDRTTIQAIAEALKRYQGKYQHLIIDPVMVSTSGCRLMQEDALSIFIQELLPLATLLTPNIPEAEILAGMKIQNKEDIQNAALAISKLGCKYVLIKGGHFQGAEKIDYLFEDGKPITSYRGLSVNTQYPRYRLYPILSHHFLSGKRIGYEYSYRHGKDLSFRRNSGRKRCTDRKRSWSGESFL